MRKNRGEPELLTIPNCLGRTRRDDIAAVRSAFIGAVKAAAARSKELCAE